MTRRPQVWAAALAALAGSAFLLSCARPDPPAHLTITPPRTVAFAALEVAGPVSISPDGSRLAFAGVEDGGKSQLWVQRLDGSPAQPLAGTANAAYPFWSPDSRNLAFFAGGQLKRVSVSGGPPQTLCQAPDPRGGAWGASGAIVFAAASATGLSLVPAAGGQVSRATTLGATEVSHRLPEFLPDGRHFLFVVIGNGTENSGIFVGHTGAGSTRRLMSSDTRVLYSPPGYLLYVQAGNLVARPFDANRVALTGEPRIVANRVDRGLNSHAGDFSVSATGVLAWRAQATAGRRLAWFDRAGREVEGLNAREPYFNPSISPDGRRIALSRLESLSPPAGNVWLLDPASNGKLQLTARAGAQLLPVWAPDGARIAYGLANPPDFGVYVKTVVGGEERLLRTPQLAVPMDWSPDGRFLLFAAFDPKTKWDLWVLPVAGHTKPEPVVRTDFNEGDGRFSPDGRWIAYWSDKSDRYEVYVQEFPAALAAGSGGARQVSTDGGTWPRWRHDGRELFFKSLDNKMMTVAIHAGSTFEAGVPEPLFDTHDLEPDNLTYDVTADGSRFLISGVFEGRAGRTVNIARNWLAGVKR